MPLASSSRADLWMGCGVSGWTYRAGEAVRCGAGTLAHQVGQVSLNNGHALLLALVLILLRMCRFLLGLLKNAQSNAEVNGLDVNELKGTAPPFPHTLSEASC